MDCYHASDVGGAVAIGVNRQSLGAYIMRSEAARTAWAASAELIGTHNYASILDSRYVTLSTPQSITALKTLTAGLAVGYNGDKFRVTSAGKATMTCAERDVLTISGSASSGAAINLNNNGKQGIFGMNANGLWFQNLYGANQPYIQLLNDGGFVLDKGTAGRFDILHDGNIYGFVPRVIYSAAGNFTSSGFAPFSNTLSPTAVSVAFSVPKTNVVRMTLGSAIYQAKQLRCFVFPTSFSGSLSMGMVGRTYGVVYLDASGAAVSNGNTLVKYIDIYCYYNGALAAPMGYAHISIELLPPTL